MCLLAVPQSFPFIFFQKKKTRLLWQTRFEEDIFIRAVRGGVCFRCLFEVLLEMLQKDFERKKDVSEVNVIFFLRFFLLYVGVCDSKRHSQTPNIFTFIRSSHVSL